MSMNVIIGHKYIQNLLDFIFPQLCLGCAEYSELEICEKCEKKLQLIKLPYCLHCMTYIENDITCQICNEKTVALYSYANYEGPMREIIIQYKFKGITKPSKIFAKRLTLLYEKLLAKYNADFLIPIPLHESRENKRGYNQATLLAKELSPFLNHPVNSSILTRVKKRKPQAKLAISDRKKNIQSVFNVESKAIDKKNCIIVDDVVTTGSTVLEAIKELENSNYKVVAVISIAHTF